MNFSPTDFTYDFSALGQYLTTQDERFSLSYEKLKQLEFTRGQEKIEKACKILNSLTDEQKKAVEFFGRTRYNDGISDEMQRHSENC